jgi:hypothetical protein
MYTGDAFPAELLHLKSTRGGGGVKNSHQLLQIVPGGVSEALEGPVDDLVGAVGRAVARQGLVVREVHLHVLKIIATVKDPDAGSKLCLLQHFLHLTKNE